MENRGQEKLPRNFVRLSAFPDLFERGAKNAEKSDAQEQRIEQLYQEVGLLTLQVNWLKRKSGLEPDAI